VENRTRILEAAARVYAEFGYRGATTRRIAHEAGVNEITLFRHFGSKDALIQAALSCAGDTPLAGLPEVPVDPERELTDWCRDRFHRMYQSRSLIRKVLGEIEEHPEIARFVKHGPRAEHSELQQYIGRLQARGLAAADVNAGAATAMLLGALFTEAMSRDIMPERFAHRAGDAIGEYVRLFLRAIGLRTARPRAARSTA
jgi:AcrR family transcriptional regulator